MVLPTKMVIPPATENPSLPEAIKLILDAYQPNPDGFALTFQQLRSYDKALKVLEDEPDDGYYALEDREVELVQLILEQAAPRILRLHSRNIPSFLDALEASPKKRPEEVIEDDRNLRGAKVVEEILGQNGHVPVVKV